MCSCFGSFSYFISYSCFMNTSIHIAFSIFFLFHAYYIWHFIDLYRNTYTCTRPYHRHILIQRDAYVFTHHSCILVPLRINLSHPDSRSDPIGGSEPVSGCENIYWDSLPDFFFQNRTCTCGYGSHLITESNIIYISKVLQAEWCPSKSIHIYRVLFTKTKLYFYIYKSERGTYI